MARQIVMLPPIKGFQTAFLDALQLSEPKVMGTYRTTSEKGIQRQITVLSDGTTKEEILEPCHDYE